jgi:hypothetical protein
MYVHVCIILWEYTRCQKHCILGAICTMMIHTDRHSMPMNLKLTSLSEISACISHFPLIHVSKILKLHPNKSHANTSVWSWRSLMAKSILAVRKVKAIVGKHPVGVQCHSKALLIYIQQQTYILTTQPHVANTSKSIHTSLLRHKTWWVLQFYYSLSNLYLLINVG